VVTSSCYKKIVLLIQQSLSSLFATVTCESTC